MKSVFPDLKTSPKPLDRTAAVVGFFKGERFDPRNMDRKFIDGRHRIRTAGCHPHLWKMTQR